MSPTINDIFIYLGEVRATAGNAFGYPTGERHPIVAFLRQTDASPDFSAAKKAVESKGWQDVLITQGAPFRTDKLPTAPQNVADSYRDAVDYGFALLVFSEAIK
jgi:hypothetical protein